ncbi:C1QL [Mytilus coruscus]|uniref:C1QL n=1 Tax=Mytilus coruscus TaxID=42192 RepID=A0A6J8CMR0_MYTCO|nr:C1QL [Mytilus coruscus]
MSLPNHWLTVGGSYTIGFYARRKQSGTLGAHQTIEFEHIHENHGNGYDPLQGHFIAPVSGLYQFSTTIYSIVNGAVHCEMVKNGQNLGQLLAPVPGYASSTLNVIGCDRALVQETIKCLRSLPPSDLSGIQVPPFPYLSPLFIRAHLPTTDNIGCISKSPTDLMKKTLNKHIPVLLEVVKIKVSSFLVFYVVCRKYQKTLMVE